MSSKTVANAVGQGPSDAHPKAFDPITLVLTAVLSVLGAVIGLNLVTTLGISPNTSVIGALVAMLVGRISFAGLSRMRSRHRQNLVQSAVSGATFAAANSLLTPIAVPFALGRPELVGPMLLGATIGLAVDGWVLYRVFDSRLLPAGNAWPPGVAAAETIKAGDSGGRRALILGVGGLVGLVGTLLKLPMSAAGVALIGNMWALLMFGVGLLVAQYAPTLFHVSLSTLYIPHGVMIGAGVVALGPVSMCIRDRSVTVRPSVLSRRWTTRSTRSTTTGCAAASLRAWCCSWPARSCWRWSAGSPRRCRRSPWSAGCCWPGSPPWCTS